MENIKNEEESVWLEEEIEAFYDTVDVLKASGFDETTIEPKILFLTVMNSKLKQKVASEKYKKLIKCLSEFNITTPHAIFDANWDALLSQLKPYQGKEFIFMKVHMLKCSLMQLVARIDMVEV